MKKILILSIMSVFFLIAGCGTDEKNEETGISGDTSADTGADIAADTTDSGDQAQADDNDSADTGNDNEPADSDNDTGINGDSDGMSDADDNNDSDDSDDSGENNTRECTGLSLDLQNLINSTAHQHIWYVGDDPRFFMQFYFEGGYGRMPDTGTYDLGSGSNTNYRTCTECVSVYKDAVNENYTKFYFQESGTLTVEPYDESTRGLHGTISATLAEIELDDKNNSTPVPNGSCIEIEAAAFNSEGCVKQCAGKDCGDDGCGGSCGTCGHDQGCDYESSKCVNLDFSGCVGLSVDWSNMKQYAVDKFYAVRNGGSDPRATIQFSQDINTGKITPGTYDLGNETNSHYKTCTECVLVYSDMFVNASGYNEYAKKYFQHDGTLIISSVDENNRISGTLSARILEATMDDKLMTNFVVGGKCFEVNSVVLNTTE